MTFRQRPLHTLRRLFVALALTLSTLGAGAMEPVNINTASADALATLKGVGRVRADAIVAHREEHGAFNDIEELTEVQGIGPTVLELNRDNIVLK